MRWLLAALVALGCAKKEARPAVATASASASAGEWVFPFSTPRASAAPAVAAAAQAEPEHTHWEVAGATMARWDGPRIVVFRVGESAVVTIAEPAGRPFTSIDLSPDGDRIETRNADYAGQIWDGRSGKPIPTVHEEEDATRAAGPAATELGGQAPRKRPWQKDFFTAGKYAPHGEHLIGHQEGFSNPDVVGVFRSKDGAMVVGWEPPDTACSSGSDWSADGRRYAGLDDESIHAVDIPSRQHEAFKVLEGEACGINLIDMTADGRYFASAYRIFAFDPMREYGRFARDCATCEIASKRPVAFSPDGQFLAVLWNGPPLETAVFRIEPFDPKPLFTFPGEASWLAGTSIVAAIQHADQPTLLLLRVPDGTRFVLDARKPDLDGLRAFVASGRP